MATENKQVESFEFRDLGIDHSQYFQGAGVAFTDWDDVFVGVGDTAKEAGDDAMESLATSDVTIPRLAYELIDAEIATMDDAESAHSGDCTAEHGPDCEMLPEGPDECSCHDECELQHYVALYVRYADPEPLDADFPVSN